MAPLSDDDRTSMDLWTHASADHEAEAAERTMERARLACVAHYAFAAQAATLAGFDDRLELIAQQLDASLAEAVGDEADLVREALVRSWREDFAKVARVTIEMPASMKAHFAATQRTASAFTEGQQAFVDGKPRVCPYAAPDGAAVGSPASKDWGSIAKEWYRGWDQANLAAPLPGHATTAAKTANKYIEQRDGKWVITQKGTGKVLSTHDSEEKAESAFRAMEMNMHGSKTAAGTPKEGDVAVVGGDPGDYYAAKPGVRGIIDLHTYNGVEPNVVAVTFRPSAFRPKDGRYVSVSGGPVPMVKIKDLKYIGETEQEFWCWGPNGPGAGNGVPYTATVGLWEWTPPKDRSASKKTAGADWSRGWARNVPDTNPDGGVETWGTRVLPDGTVVQLHRGPKNRVRFYDEQGNQHGEEQANVAQAFAYSETKGWHDPDSVRNHYGPIGGGPDPSDPKFGAKVASDEDFNAGYSAHKSGEPRKAPEGVSSDWYAGYSSGENETVQKGFADMEKAGGYSPSGGPGWYVVSDSGVDVDGPFPSEEEAREALGDWPEDFSVENSDAITDYFGNNREGSKRVFEATVYARPHASIITTAMQALPDASEIVATGPRTIRFTATLDTPKVLDPAAVSDIKLVATDAYDDDGDPIEDALHLGYADALTDKPHGTKWDNGETMKWQEQAAYDKGYAQGKSDNHSMFGSLQTQAGIADDGQVHVTWSKMDYKSFAIDPEPGEEHWTCKATNDSAGKSVNIEAWVATDDYDRPKWRWEAVGRRLDGYELEVDQDGMADSLDEGKRRVEEALRPLWAKGRYAEDEPAGPGPQSGPPRAPQSEGQMGLFASRKVAEFPPKKKDDGSDDKKDAPPKDDAKKDDAPPTPPSDGGDAPPTDPAQQAAAPPAVPQAPQTPPHGDPAAAVGAPPATAPAGAPQAPASPGAAPGAVTPDSDPTQMDVGAKTRLTYTMTDGATGNVEAIFVREDKGVYFYNGPTGEFGVTNTSGTWQDADGNTFTFASPDGSSNDDDPMKAKAPDDVTPEGEQASTADDKTPTEKPAADGDKGSDDGKKKDAPPWAKKD